MNPPQIEATHRIVVVLRRELPPGSPAWVLSPGASLVRFEVEEALRVLLEFPRWGLVGKPSSLHMRFPRS